MPRKPGKHTPYFELVDAQSQPGCPVCRMIYRATDRYLDSLLYEAVLDPEVRAKLKRSQGFCPEHVEMLKRKPGRALGVAIIYRDIIREISEDAEGGRFRREGSPLRTLLGRARGGAGTAAELQSAQPCPACAIGEKTEANNLGLLLTHLDDEKLYGAYTAGEGLCLEHFRRAIEMVRDESAFWRLIDPQVARYRAMLHDLDEFIRKRDHRFHGEKYGEEGDVWLRAMNAIVGGAGMGLGAQSGGRRSAVLKDEHPS